MTKLEKVAISHNFNFRRWWCFFVPVQEQFAENTNKSYHVCRVIFVLHIYHKMLGIRLAGPSANKNKSLILIKF